MTSTGLLDRLRGEAVRQRSWQRRHRLQRHAAAFLRGNFWIPCPLCGEEFGGHEWIGRVQLPTGEPGMTRGVCQACELDLAVAALPMCEKDGHRPTWVISESTSTTAPDGTIELAIEIDFSKPPIYGYCVACGLDLPIELGEENPDA